MPEEEQDWHLIFDDDLFDTPFLKAQLAKMRECRGSAANVLKRRHPGRLGYGTVPEININSEPLSESELARRREESM